jgi:hypothetical protein
MICNECETVAHCTKHGCVPKQPAPVQPVKDNSNYSLDPPGLDPCYTTPPTAQPEPDGWAISYDGKTPYAIWPEGDGPLLNLEVKRQGGTCCKLPLYTTPPAQPAVPDSIHHTDLSESLEYIQGWNDCRAEMLEMMK